MTCQTNCEQKTWKHSKRTKRLFIAFAAVSIAAICVVYFN